MVETFFLFCFVFYQRCFSELYCLVEIKSLKENVTQFNLGLMLFCVETVDVDKIPTGRYRVVLINHRSSTESLVLSSMESLGEMIG